jgi:hypothetical protein
MTSGSRNLEDDDDALAGAEAEAGVDEVIDVEDRGLVRGGAAADLSVLIARPCPSNL